MATVVFQSTAFFVGCNLSCCLYPWTDQLAWTWSVKSGSLGGSVDRQKIFAGIWRQRRSRRSDFPIKRRQFGDPKTICFAWLSTTSSTDAHAQKTQFASASVWKSGVAFQLATKSSCKGLNNIVTIIMSFSLAAVDLGCRYSVSVRLTHGLISYSSGVVDSS